MERKALLLYLQNVRDLEIAKNSLKCKGTECTTKFQLLINGCQTKPKYKTVETPTKQGLESIPFAVIMLLLVIFITWIKSVEGYSGFIEAFTTLLLLFFFSVFVIIIAKNLLAYRAYKEEMNHYFYEKEMVEEYNKKQNILAQHGRERQLFLQKQWTEENDMLKTQFVKVSQILEHFYSMNLLPSQYRNLASTIYIYDYMSTSQASLEDTLIHEHMENGIKRLETKLNQIVDRLDDIVYETRCIRDENRANVERVISENSQMLSELQEISSNTQDAAQYAELAANYSKANAYFSLANYFRR